MKLYTPPPGFYDLPFTWTYDASQLTDGNDYQNQFIYLLGGYGDFMLRRIVGLSQILNPATGQYQIRKRDSGEYIQSERTYAANAFQNYYCPEIPYRELGNIRFDLYKILRPVTPGPQAAQLAFQGVRRLPGSQIVRPVRATPKTFTYLMNVSLPNPYPAPAVSSFLQIDDYDFELYNIILTVLIGASLTIQIEPGWFATANTANYPGALGNTITFEKIQNANQAAQSVTVSGTNIVYLPQTDGAGNAITTLAQAVAFLNATPAVAALANFTFAGLGGPGTINFGSFGPSAFTGGSTAPVTSPTAALWIYDHARVQISNAPVLDIYVDGSSEGFYGSQVGQARGQQGALVPPLYYPKESQIQIDVMNLTAAATGLVITLVGKQYYPC